MEWMGRVDCGKGRLWGGWEECGNVGGLYTGGVLGPAVSVVCGGMYADGSYPGVCVEIE